MSLHIEGPQEQTIDMTAEERGYFRTSLPAAPGTRYYFGPAGAPKTPDPASRFQPQGVHGPSAVVDPRFNWNDASWRGTKLEDCVFYELHTGTFSKEGTFTGIKPYLPYLKDLGVNVIELMPVAQFPGSRNWGYDGAFPFAVQNSYGGPRGLKDFVAACHQQGLGVALDVVYNHLGPEGAYLGSYGPYFTDSYKTPWGKAVNYDGAWSDEVRAYFIANALYWITEFHIDVLRLDALHAIYDFSAYPFLEELNDVVKERAAALRREVHLIAESDLNDPRLLNPKRAGGFGLDAQWLDDFHHIVHTLFSGETTGYYEDFGSISQLKKCLAEGYIYSGDYSSHRQRRHGRSSSLLARRQFVAFIQNHDQVGNRRCGDRLSTMLSFEQQKTAAALLCLSPYLPLLFMGEEYGEPAPFCYFVSHEDERLLDAVRKGRTAEFSAWMNQGGVPDPGAEETFLSSKLRHERREEEPHRTLLAWYRTLLELRRRMPALRSISIMEQEVSEVKPAGLFVSRRAASAGGESKVWIAYNLGSEALQTSLPETAEKWSKLLDSTDPQWRGSGPAEHKENRLVLPPCSALLFEGD